MKWALPVVVAAIILLEVLLFIYRHGVRLYSRVTSRKLNARGGMITIRNARIWTGDPEAPWASAMTIRQGKIVAMDANNPAGRRVDAHGKLVVPGLWDGHTHVQAPYVLTSPEAPTLFGAKTVAEVLQRLRKYVAGHPSDKFPRLFGWMDAIFKEGEKPTRQLIDAVVSDRPVYLVHHGGHEHWANTKALEAAGALEHDPPDMCGGGSIERDPETGLATGHLKETEYAATHGLMLNAVKRVEPFTFDEQVLIQRIVLEMCSPLGITSIWNKDGDIDLSRVFERILRDDGLPVRATLDNMYTPYSKTSDLRAFAERGEEIRRSKLPKGFLRADVVKLFLDLPDRGWIWMSEPYADDAEDCGTPPFSPDAFRCLAIESDKLGLQMNLSIYGDRAVHECLNVLEEVAETNRPRDRRVSIEHAEFIRDEDLPRFKELGVIATMNPIGGYPDPGFQSVLESHIGPKRLSSLYQRYKDLIAAGAVVVSGSDFPLAPIDPMVGIHILVTGTDIYGKPEGGLWPHKQITVEEALRTYTVNPAYANFAEDRLGMLKVGYDADFVILSDDILDPDFDTARLAWVKANLTVLNGHITHEDFSDTPKAIDFQH